MTNEKIERFFEKRLLTAPNTLKTYRININNYFKTLNEDMDTYFQNKTKEEYEEDLRKVYTIFQKNGKPDLSTRTFFNSIKQFLISQDKDFKELEFWDILKARTRGAEPDNDEAKLNANDIREILNHGNACSRALFLMLASSGRRISEILALTLDDVNLKVTPATINIRKGLDRNQTKTKQKTLCFISEEAKTALEVWLKERNKYLENSKARRERFKKKPSDMNRIFPMTYDNAIIIWRNLLIRGDLTNWERVKSPYHGRMIRKIKRERKGKRLMQHPHCLRKFFRSYLGDADLAEYLMGHSTIMTRTYRQMKHEDLAEKYLKFMPNVTIFERPVDLSGINKSLKEKDEEIQTMKAELLEMRLTMLELKEKLNGKKKVQ